MMMCPFYPADKGRDSHEDLSAEGGLAVADEADAMDVFFLSKLRVRE